MEWRKSKIYSSSNLDTNKDFPWIGAIENKSILVAIMLLIKLQKLLRTWTTSFIRWCSVTSTPWNVFMGDSAHANFSRISREYLNVTYLDRLIGGRDGPVLLPPPCTDCNFIYFFLWGHLVTLVYVTSINIVQQLRDRVANSCETIGNTAGIFDMWDNQLFDGWLTVDIFNNFVNRN